MMRSGRCRSVALSRSRSVTAGSARTLAPCLEADQIRCVDLELRGVLNDEHDAVSSGEMGGRRLSSVVFPVPVPPLIRMLSSLRDGGERSSPSECRGVSIPARDEFVGS